ncbi:hypothetical protein ACIQZB_42710 [Streptomyces sp. NPDC097727]|uniref:hypothetical protein n=1 Tax=Streptomyces sp. NPDC097727 TaxID=3366092 RepID=UPI0037F1C783
MNETVIAMLRPEPNLAKLTEDPPEVRAAAQSAVDAPDGIGAIASYWTEVPLPATGTRNAPGKGGAQADIVLTAPQYGVPLLFIEADNCLGVLASVSGMVLILVSGLGRCGLGRFGCFYGVLSSDGRALVLDMQWGLAGR